MLKLINVKKSFGTKEVLNDIDINVSKPAIYGLLGPNGAGKTTLIRIICGILNPSSGKVVFDDSINLENVSYMPDTIGLYKDMTVKDEIMYFGKLHGLSPDETLKNTGNYIKLFQLEQYVNMPIAVLSKGTARKVQFICTLLPQSDIIILDEPFSGLDPVSSMIMENIILGLKNKGKTIILSTHRMEHAERFCDHIFMINHGQIVIDDDVQHLKMLNARSEYIIESYDNIFFSCSNVLHTVNNDGLNRYTIQISETYSYANMIEDIKNHHLVQLRLSMPNLNEIFISTIRKT